MKRLLQASGRTIEEFVGTSDRGEFNQALAGAIKTAQLTLGTEEIRWTMLQLSGQTAPGAHTLTVAIKAKRSDA